MFFPIRTIIFLAVIIGVIFLQIFLSKKQNKWLGLILPLICFMFSLIIVLGSTAFFFMTGELSLQELAPDGTVVEETVEVQDKGDSSDIGATIIQMVVVFALYNIPTAILLMIYFACREKIKKRSQLDKMNIQDLE